MKIFIACPADLRRSRMLTEFQEQLVASGHELVEQPQPDPDVEEDTVTALRASDLVLCILAGDVSGVLLATGYAMGAGKSVLLLASPDLHLPRDLRSVSCVRGDIRDPSVAFSVAKALEEMGRGERAVAKHFDSFRDVLLTYDEDRSYFDSLGHEAVEDCIFRWFDSRGYRPSRNLESGLAYDIVLDSFGGFRRTLVELKKLSGSLKVSVRPVQALKDAMYEGNADHAILITSSDFTPSARRLAESYAPEIELWHLRRILNDIREDQENERAQRRRRDEDLVRAHEAAMPLQMIGNNVAYIGEYLRREGRLDQQLRQVVEDTEDQIERAAFMNRFSLLLAAGNTDWRLERLSFQQDVLLPVLRMLKHLAATNGVVVTIDRAFDAMPPMYLDKTRMMAVVYNLLSNAVRYSYRSSEVRVSISHTDGWVVTVASRSIPISEDDVGHLFEYGYRGRDAKKREFMGVGRGLFICRQIMSEIGSWVRLTSRANPVAFSFLLPQSVDTPGWL